MKRGSYDERQINAKLVICAVCKKPWYFTDHQQTVCIECAKRS